MITNPGTRQRTCSSRSYPRMGGLPTPAGPARGPEPIPPERPGQRLRGAQSRGRDRRSRADQPLLIRARTYNTAATGTFGVALPVFPTTGSSLPATPAHSLWVSQSATEPGYRTNIAVVFPDAGGGDATVTIFDATGNEAGSAGLLARRRRDSSSSGSASFAGAVSGRARRRCRSRAAGQRDTGRRRQRHGRLLALLLRGSPRGYQDVLVNGVARADGRNGTFFRTDGRFYNPARRGRDRDGVVHAPAREPQPVAADSRSSSRRGGSWTCRRPRPAPRRCRSAPRARCGFSRTLPSRSSAGRATSTRRQRPGTFGAQQRADAAPVLPDVGGRGRRRHGHPTRTPPSGRTSASRRGRTAPVRAHAEERGGSDGRRRAASLGAFGWTQPNVAGPLPGRRDPRRRDAAGEGDVGQRRPLRLVRSTTRPATPS